MILVCYPSTPLQINRMAATKIEPNNNIFEELNVGKSLKCSIIRATIHTTIVPNESKKENSPKLQPRHKTYSDLQQSLEIDKINRKSNYVLMPSVCNDNFSPKTPRSNNGDKVQTQKIITEKSSILSQIPIVKVTSTVQITAPNSPRSPRASAPVKFENPESTTSNDSTKKTSNNEEKKD